MDKVQPEKVADKSPKPAALKKIKFTVHTYPDLHPFLEMAILMLEGVYEHMSTLDEIETN